MAHSVEQQQVHPPLRAFFRASFRPRLFLHHAPRKKLPKTFPLFIPGDRGILHRYVVNRIEWVAEMFGYVLAAAHLGLRHELVDLQMVPSVGRHRAMCSWHKCTVDITHCPPRDMKQGCCICNATRRMRRASDLRAAGALCTSQVHRSMRPGVPFLHFHIGIETSDKKKWGKTHVNAHQTSPWPVPPGTDAVTTRMLQALHDAREVRRLCGTPLRCPSGRPKIFGLRTDFHLPHASAATAALARCPWCCSNFPQTALMLCFSRHASYRPLGRPRGLNRTSGETTGQSGSTP